jgi:cleavage and polyadenylation specificity factor subunit 1
MLNNEKASRYIAGCFFTDTSGFFETKSKDDDDSTADKTSTLPAVMSASKRTQWLVLVRPHGILEVSEAAHFEISLSF